MKVFTILLAIFVTVIFAIILIRLVFSAFLYHASKNLKKIKKLAKKTYPKKKNYLKEEEELKREKIEFPKAHSEIKAEMRAKGNRANNGSYELIPSKEQELYKEDLNNVEIVDIVKPVGFWTAMILGQKLTYLIHSAQILNKRGDKGFWASMIEAKEKAAGRQHSRGR
ncbi:MAG: hypothetical protein KGQ36_06760 [Rickettsiales bacterium]|nr:hypothetical protein [Rickettsiales bacterium]